MPDDIEKPHETKANGLALWQIMRPKHWIKNVFVLAPLFFSMAFLQVESILLAVGALVYFCIAASSVYIVNDIADLEYDKQHEEKAKTRPLASGALSLGQCITLLIILYIFLLTSLFIFPAVTLVLLVYIVTNIAYSYILKYEPVADIFTVAIGFVLRVFAGGAAIDVPISGWMFVTVLCLALFLAAIKRLQELRLHGADTRGVLSLYNERIIARFAEMAATGALVFYSLFVLSEAPDLVLTIPLVLYGLFRYWYIAELHQKGESPGDTLLADWQLGATVVIWGVLTVYQLIV